MDLGADGGIASTGPGLRVLRSVVRQLEGTFLPFPHSMTPTISRDRREDRFEVVSTGNMAWAKKTMNAMTIWQ